MSLETLVSSDIEKSGKVSAGALAYLAQRARNNCYDYVMSRFLSSKLNKADLARRIGKSQAQINHMLASPGNWTIRTLAELLAGISDEEFIPSSKSLKGRPPRNITQADLLGRYDDGDYLQRKRGTAAGTVEVEWTSEPKNERRPLPGSIHVTVTRARNESESAL